MLIHIRCPACAQLPQSTWETAAVAVHFTDWRSRGTAATILSGSMPTSLSASLMDVGLFLCLYRVSPTVLKGASMFIQTDTATMSLTIQRAPGEARMKTESQVLYRLKLALNAAWGTH